MLIEAVTGNNWYDEIRTRFLTPLNLSSVAIPAYENVGSPVCHVWMDITGDNIVDDAHAFFFNWLSINAAGGAAGGYYGTARDVSTWMHAYMRGDLHTAGTMTEAKTTVFAPGLPAVTYGLGLMKRTFLGYEAYGHGGDLVYSGTSWYFPQLDISISVLNNDSRITSWDLSPVVAELLQAYLNWQVAENTEIASEHFTIYPQPFGDHFSINTEQTGLDGACFTLYTLSGNVMTTLHPQENTLLFDQLEGLSSGTYLLNITTRDNRSFTRKVVKQ